MCVYIRISDEQEHHRYLVTEQEWNELCAVLDAPPKSDPALSKLMNTPSVFETDAG